MLRPPEPRTHTIAVITFDERTVRVKFPEKRNDFNGLVKQLGYHWEWPYWQRSLTARSGTPQDRAAELAARLLEVGFCIETDAVTEQQAIAGDYALEHRRWVLRRTAGQYVDHFVLEWERDADLYHKALRLTGAKYRAGHFLVPGGSYEEVLDFADVHGFKFTQAARELVEQERAKWQAGLIVDVKAKRQPKPVPAAFESIGIAPELLDTP
jgi:hypothetical protein